MASTNTTNSSFSTGLAPQCSSQILSPTAQKDGLWLEHWGANQVD